MRRYSALKKGNPAMCNCADGPRQHYAKQKKPDRKKLHDSIHV